MAGTRRPVFALLLWPSARTMPWLPFVAIVSLAVAVVHEGVRDGRDPGAVALPMATTMLGVWLCLTFDDQAAELVSPAPSPIWVRRAVRTSISVPAAAAAWLGFTFIGPLQGPTGPMAAMFAAVSLLALAFAAIARRALSTDRAGIAAAFGLVGVTIALPFVLGLALERPIAIDPARVVLGKPASYWSAAIGIAIMLLGLAHRDPAMPGFLARLRRAVPQRPVPHVPAGELR